MGLEIDRDRFEAEDYRRFEARLRHCLDALRELLSQAEFGVGPPSIGAELEVALVDERARPLPLNVEILHETLDPRMTVELNRFNLECNLNHTDLAGTPFAALRSEFEGALDELRRAAAVHAGRPVMVGILPTVQERDLQPSVMTDTARYRALAFALREARHAPFDLDIAGEDPLLTRCDGVTFEGAATSLQIHLRVNPERFTDLFNAVQLATAPVLAAAGNSPTFIGHRLWHETRVALFKQAVDDRDALAKRARRQPRVGFGTGWLVDGALELFDEALDLFPPLLPLMSDEDPRECMTAGGVPELHELRLHQGTVWNWNRPVYDPAGGGHLRIEMRALPSGPTVTDMLTNAAFLIGLAYGLETEIVSATERIDFRAVQTGFYRAAQSGLEAEVAWADGLLGVAAPEGLVSARELLPQLVDVARAGLAGQGVSSEDSEPLLQVMVDRAASGQTGSVWQSRTLATLERQASREEALMGLVERYVGLSASGQPVHQWPGVG
jgi:hypothetical protein